MNRLHTHRARTDCKNYKVSLRDEKRSYMCGQRQTLDSKIYYKSKLVTCHANIEYCCTPITFILYIFIFTSCELEMMHLRNYLDDPPEASLTFRLTRFLVLKPFLKPYYNPSIVEGTGDSRNELLQKKFIWLSVLP